MEGDPFEQIRRSAPLDSADSKFHLQEALSAQLRAPLVGVAERDDQEHWPDDVEDALEH
jgi:hypothetical protein